MNTIRDQARTVVNLRAATALVKAELEAKRTEWETANAVLIGQLMACQSDLATAELALRREAIAAYQQDPTSKRLSCGIGIRVTRRPAYHDEDAFGWAITHGVALKLDKKVFDDLAKTNPAMVPFVEWVEEPTATIPTDLAGAIEVQP